MTNGKNTKNKNPGNPVQIISIQAKIKNIK
jgi:hypothetical protein